MRTAFFAEADPLQARLMQRSKLPAGAGRAGCDSIG